MIKKMDSYVQLEVTRNKDCFELYAERIFYRDKGKDNREKEDEIKDENTHLYRVVGDRVSELHKIIRAVDLSVRDYWREIGKISFVGDFMEHEKNLIGIPVGKHNVLILMGPKRRNQNLYKI